MPKIFLACEKKQQQGYNNAIKKKEKRNVIVEATIQNEELNWLPL